MRPRFLNSILSKCLLNNKNVQFNKFHIELISLSKKINLFFKPLFFITFNNLI